MAIQFEEILNMLDSENKQRHNRNWQKVAQELSVLISDLLATNEKLKNLPAGPSGKSAYELWKELGNTGTLEQFIASLKGEDGPTLNDVTSALQPTVTLQVQNEFNKLSASKQVDSEVINARGGKDNLGTRLNVFADSIGVSIKDYPRLDGETDDRNRFQRAIDYLQSVGGGKLVIPSSQGDYLFNAPANVSVNTPYRCLITGSNIDIVGSGLPLVNMKGLSKSYLDGVSDVSSSGRDIFTVFSFVGGTNNSVSGIRFKGEWDGKGTFNYASPRAKAIGFIGASFGRVDNVYGEGIMGNTVNATNSMPDIDSHYKWSENISITNSTAIRCLENGFNLMGGTRNGKVTGNFSTLNGTCGIEVGAENVTISNNISKANKLTGISFSGINAVISNNVLMENTNNGELTGQHPAYGMLISGRGDLSISNNKFTNNEGSELLIYPNVNDITIKNNTFKHNDSSVSQFLMYISGTVDQKVTNIDISDNVIYNTSTKMAYTVMLNNVDNVRIIDNYIESLYGTYSILVQDTCKNVIMKDNIADKQMLSQATGDSFDLTNVGKSNVKRVTASEEPGSGFWKRGDSIENTAYNIDSGHPDKWRCISEGYANKNPWVAQKTYGVGDIINANSKVYKVKTAGTSGDVAPSHTTGTATDGTVTIEYVGDLAVFEVAGQVGLYPVIVNKPMFVGQIAKTGAGTVHIAIGTSSTSDWKQISN